ncbi:MAG: hypothetical protein OXG44_01175 [Gammaproteobacteria bacterium]|nr:hypothetical protein [Gammaproteobacteria bacterium]
MHRTTLDQPTLDKVSQRIVEVAQPEKIILFGSGDVERHRDSRSLPIKPALREGRVIYEAA